MQIIMQRCVAVVRIETATGINSEGRRMAHLAECRVSSEQFVLAYTSKTLGGAPLSLKWLARLATNN